MRRENDEREYLWISIYVLMSMWLMCDCIVPSNWFTIFTAQTHRYNYALTQTAAVSILWDCKTQFIVLFSKFDIRYFIYLFNSYVVSSFIGPIRSDPCMRLFRIQKCLNNLYKNMRHLVHFVLNCIHWATNDEPNFCKTFVVVNVYSS